MVKTRENTRTNKFNTGAKIVKITTPNKTMNGKVQKVRSNIKNNIQLNKEDLKQNTIQNQTFQKTLPCYIKLRRTPSSDLYNNNNTLQEQCKVIEENQQKVDKRIDNNVQPLGESVKIINKEVENPKKTRNRKKGDNASKTSSCKRISENPNLLEQKKHKITAITKEIGKDLHLDNMESNSAIRILHQKDQPLLNPFTARKCMVKLQRTLTQNKKENVASVVPVTPSNNKRCKVKLRRTPVTTKAKEIFDKPLSPKIIRKSVISIKKRPISKINIKKNDECTETISCDQQSFFLTPEIHNKKRDNLRKLSLTNSSRKSRKENKENENCENYKEAEEILKNNIENSKTTTLNNQKTLTTNDNKLISIKRFGKLSLKKPNVQKQTNTTNLEITQFEPEQNSAIYFEPARNSTVLDFGSGLDKQQEKQTNALDKKTASPKNLANKSEEIYELLNSLEDDEEIVLKSPVNKNENDYNIENKIDRSREIQDIILPSNKINKFFHRSKKDGENDVFKEPVPTKIKSLLQNQKRRVIRKRSSIARRENVYEFLSQSQTSDSDSAKHSDPTADIVKKLIQQGKVRVATTNKGKGKPKFKRRVPAKQIKKNKQTANTKVKHLKNIAKKVLIEENNEEEDYHFADDFCYNDELDIGNDTQIQKQDIVRKKISNHKNKNQTNDQEGTFSRLARSVLINQAGRSDMQRKNSPKLLEMVKKMVSTPNNKKMSLTPATLETDLSPIAMPPIRPITKPSPWRVNEDAYLPTTFNFSRSSSNLPSFSSGFIPSTPRKEKRNKNLDSLQQSTMNIERSPIKSNQSIVLSISSVPTPLQDEQEHMQSPPEQACIDIEPSVISSFSSNDSNAENMPPPKATSENYIENESIFDLKQQPNPRRALKYRSPLKAINILEVVHLPPYKPPLKTPDTLENNREIINLFGFEENLVDDSLQAKQSFVSDAVSPQKTAIKKINDCPKEDLFGFEDFLSQTEYSSEENNVTTTNQTIHEKLQNLRKLKPQENELEKNVLSEKFRNPIESIHVFDDDDVTKPGGMKQGNIKNMLSSTTIYQQQSTSKEAFKNKKRKNYGNDLDLSELFKDPEPEVTFNESDPHRTYIRPYKRKRRLKENNFVMFLDSDESGDENNSPIKQAHQVSHESNSSTEQAPKQKRHRKDIKHKENPELIKFMEEFNEECKGVDSYDLVIERSA